MNKNITFLLRPKFFSLLLIVCLTPNLAFSQYTLLFDKIPDQTDVERLIMSNEILSKMKGKSFSVDVIGHGNIGQYFYSKHSILDISTSHNSLCNFNELEAVRSYFSKKDAQGVFYLAEGGILLSAGVSRCLPISSFNKLYKKTYNSIVFTHLVLPENKWLKDVALNVPDKKFMVGDKVQLKLTYNTNLQAEELEVSFKMNDREYTVQESGVVEVSLDETSNIIQYKVQSKTSDCRVEGNFIIPAKSCDTKLPIYVDMHYDSFLYSNEAENVYNVARWQVSDNYIFSDSLKKYAIGYCYIIPVHFECPVSEVKVLLKNDEGQILGNPLVQQVSRLNEDRVPMINLNAPFDSSRGNWSCSKVGRELYKAVYKAPIPDDVEFILFKPEGDLGKYFQLRIVPVNITNTKWQFPPYSIGFESCENN
jgi:hypothetical protein